MRGRHKSRAACEVRRRANIRAAALGFNDLRDCLYARLAYPEGTGEAACELAFAAINRGLPKAGYRGAISQALGVSLDYWTCDEAELWRLLSTLPPPDPSPIS